MATPKRNWTVLGIDPGKIPTMCVLSDRGRTVKIYDPKHLARADFKSQDKLPDSDKMRRVMQACNPELVVIERVWVRPGQGIASQAHLVRGAALVEGVAAGLDLNILRVLPQTWKKYYGLKGGAENKGASVRYVQDQYPMHIDPYFAAKWHHNRAEAFLLALFGMKYLDRLFKNNVERRGASLDHTPVISVYR